MTIVMDAEVGKFASEQEAQALCEKLRKEGIGAYTQPSPDSVQLSSISPGKRTTFSVMVPHDQKDKALELLK